MKSIKRRGGEPTKTKQGFKSEYKKANLAQNQQKEEGGKVTKKQNKLCS